jgi:hypothetical protein
MPHTFAELATPASLFDPKQYFAGPTWFDRLCRKHCGYCLGSLRVRADETFLNLAFQSPVGMLQQPDQAANRIVPLCFGRDTEGKLTSQHGDSWVRIGNQVSQRGP